MAQDKGSDERQSRLRGAGAWLRTQRETRGWSGSDLARQLGINQVRVSAYERGQYEVPDEVAADLSATFDIPLIEVRRRLGLWVPTDSELAELHHHSDPGRLSDDALVAEFLRRHRKRTDREIVDVYPHRSQVPRELWDRLISSARTSIILGGYTNYFFWTERPDFGETLRRKAQEGVEIRVLVGDPELEVTRRRERIENAPLSVGTRIRITLDELGKLGPIPGVQVRMSDVNAEAHVSRSVFAFDREALVCEHIADRLGHGSLTLHLRRLQEGGPYDQYLAHVDHLWQGGRPWNPTPPVGGAREGG